MVSLAHFHHCFRRPSHRSDQQIGTQPIRRAQGVNLPSVIRERDCAAAGEEHDGLREFGLHNCDLGLQELHTREVLDRSRQHHLGHRVSVLNVNRFVQHRGQNPDLELDRRVLLKQKRAAGLFALQNGEAPQQEPNNQWECQGITANLDFK